MDAKYYFPILIIISCICIQANCNVRSKISLPLQSKLVTKSHMDILVTFGSTKDVLEPFLTISIPNRNSRLNAVASALKKHASTSQENVIQYLTEVSPGSFDKFKVLWITNEIYVKGAKPDLIQALSWFKEVKFIQEDEVFPLETNFVYEPEVNLGSTRYLSEAVVDVRAPEVWEAENGTRGEGVIVSTINTGVRGTHEALRDNFLGDYGWYDPYSESESPTDGNGQGTFVAGILAGSFGIGVAPGAKWSACKGCADSGSCTNSALLSCGQFTLCPTLPNGTAEDCSKAPHAVANSWGAGSGNFFEGVLQAWRAAGIAGFFTSGSTGACGWISYPGSSDHAFTMGTLTSVDGLSPSSGKGPSSSGSIKPNFVARGNANSSYHTSDSAYQVFSGSVGASPLGAGTVSLLQSAAGGSLTFNQVNQFLCQGSNRNLVPTGLNCGGIPDDEFPNNSYGCGKLDAFESFKALNQTRSSS